MKFEPTLPTELRKDLNYIFAISKANTEEEDIESQYQRPLLDEDEESLRNSAAPIERLSES